MATLAVEVGHIIVGDRGIVLRADAGFAAIMRTNATDIVGRRLLDMTAPEDRQLCGDLMQALRAGGRPFRVAKRMLRDDGSTVWVDKTVAFADFDDPDRKVPPLVMATIVPIERPERLADPARLLATALSLRDGRRAQRMVFGRTLFTDVAWDVLLAAYIAEVRGETLSAETIADEAMVSRTVAQRWIGALEAKGLIEREGSATHCRMTGEALSRFESYLGNRIHRSSGVVEPLQ